MRHTRRHLWRVLAALLALGLIAAACGDDGGDEPTTASTGIVGGEVGGDDDEGDEEIVPTHGGRIIVGLEAETNDYSPATAQLASPGWSIALTFYDPLISLDAEGDFQPFLAESLEPNADLTEWTLTLRDGVTFHDGSPLDAETLKWNWDTFHFAEGVRNRGSLVAAGLTGEGMEIVDDMTVVYTLEGPNAAFPDLLRSYPGLPASRVAYEADPEGYGSNPVGTGAFVFKEWTRDDRLIVERNDNWWFSPDLPYLDEVEFRPIADDESRTASLASDDIQVLQTLRGTSVKRVLAMVDDGGFAGNLHVGNESSATLINTAVPPLDDVRIRQALALANDQEQMAAVRDDDGLVPPSTGFFSPDSPWYSAEATSAYPDARDVAAATALVDAYKNDTARSDGGAPGDPISIDYQCQPDPSLLQGAQLLQSLWGEIGIDLVLAQVDQPTMITNVVGSADTAPPFVGNYELACWRAGGGTGDPLSALQNFFGTSSGNFTNYTNPEIDDAVEQLRSSADFATRYAAVETISRVTAEEVPLIWNVATPTMVGYRGDVRGIPTWTLPDGSAGTGTPSAIMRFHEAFLAQ